MRRAPGALHFEHRLCDRAIEPLLFRQTPRHMKGGEAIVQHFVRDQVMSDDEGALNVEHFRPQPNAHLHPVKRPLHRLHGFFGAKARDLDTPLTGPGASDRATQLGGAEGPRAGSGGGVSSKRFFAASSRARISAGVGYPSLMTVLRGR